MDNLTMAAFGAFLVAGSVLGASVLNHQTTPVTHTVFIGNQSYELTMTREMSDAALAYCVEWKDTGMTANKTCERLLRDRDMWY